VRCLCPKLRNPGRLRPLGGGHVVAVGLAAMLTVAACRAAWARVDRGLASLLRAGRRNSAFATAHLTNVGTCRTITPVLASEGDMCNSACIDFGRTELRREDVQSKAVIEVGSLDLNGSLRSVVEAMRPGHYVGVDLVPGPGVDTICDASDLVRAFGPCRFDLVICTEVVEHVRDWRAVMSNLKLILRPGGTLLLTTRAPGFHFHGYPYDFWRYDQTDMQAIFSDFAIEALEPDPLMPGVFLKARKPATFAENDLSHYELYSVITRRSARDVRDRDIWVFKIRYRIRRLLTSLIRPRERLRQRERARLRQRERARLRQRERSR